MSALKRFVWFLFKSPQRNMVGWQSLWTDAEGIISIVLQRFFKQKNHEIIWICVGNKNRSRALLQHLIPSISGNTDKKCFGISVADCASTDVADLEKEIKQIWQGPLVFSSEPTLFYRSVVFNRAIEQAPGSLVFVCDADMQLPNGIAKYIYRNTGSKVAWFPICQWQLQPAIPDWKWFTAGTGIFAAQKSVLAKTGLYNEEILSWGTEDWDLFFRMYKNNIMPYRSRCKGLYHHWHPSQKPADYKNMF